MNILRHRFSALVVASAVLTLGACASAPPPADVRGASPYYPGTAQPRDAYAHRGVVQSIDLIRMEQSSLGAGTVAGAVVGGIVGHQIGSGSGNTAATVLGAAGGAYVGHALEKQNQPATDAYKLTVRMADGSYQTVVQTTSEDIRVGDRVQIDNGVVRRY